MRVCFEVPDGTPPAVLASLRDCARSGEFLAIRRPPGLSNEQAASFCTEAQLVLRGLVREHAVLEESPPELIARR